MNFGDVFDPSTGAIQTTVALASADEVRDAIAAAEAAFPAWRAVNPQRRARVLFKFKDLVEKEIDGLARLLPPSTEKSSPTPRATFSAVSR